MHTRRHSDGQLSKGGRRLQVTTQRPPGQCRPQVCDAEKRSAAVPEAGVARDIKISLDIVLSCLEFQDKIKTRFLISYQDNTKTKTVKIISLVKIIGSQKN